MVALLLLLGPVQASAASLFAADGPGHHRCSDHVCACAKSCPSKKPQTSRVSCHGAQAPTGPLMSAAGCRHGGDSATTPAIVRPHLTPTAVSLEPSAATAAVPVGDDGGRRSGFFDIDLPPPRFS